MQGSDERVLEAALATLNAGGAGWLFTIAATHGASPRPVGSLMWLAEDGTLCGSISGGCIEDDLLDKRISGGLPDGRPALLEYGVSAAENERFGLPCGGRMQLLVESLRAPQIGDLEAVVAALAVRRAIRRRVNFSLSGWELEAVDRCSALVLASDGLQQDFGPRFQLLLVGANELARCIAEIASGLDYRVLVCDPREDRCAQWTGDHSTILQQMPDEAVAEYATDRHSIVITLTHDPRIDDMALMQALTQDLFYIGALGSERTSSRRRERLRQLDLTEQQLDRLRAPVGLPIGSKSAMEIAVAVMAELTALRHRRVLTGTTLPIEETA